MTNPNIYQELEALTADVKTLKDDVEVLQIAIALISEKLYPSVKIDASFWNNVHAIAKQFREDRAKKLEEAEATE